MRRDREDARRKRWREKGIEDSMVEGWVIGEGFSFLEIEGCGEVLGRGVGDKRREELMEAHVWVSVRL